MSARRRAGLGILSLLLVALTACAGLPTSGPVNAGLPIGEGTAHLDVDFLPERPAPGASPRQIVEGFVDAATSPAGGFEIARSFLAPALRDVWDPSAGVTIDQPGSRTFSDMEGDTVTVSLTPTADVDESGSYRVSEAQGSTNRSYVVAQQPDGEYRVVAAPDGILLDAETFKVVYASFSLMYFDPSWRFLVPDVRWFPARTNSATNIVSALVEGKPSPWLEGAVFTAFQDVSLRSKTVPVSGGVAKVELDAAVLGRDDLTLSRMQAQLQASLASAGVPNVEMFVGPNALDVTASPTASTKVDGRALVQTASGFGFISGDELEPIPGLSAQLARRDSRSIEVAASQEFAAVLGAAGEVARVPSEGDAIVLDARAGLIAPTVDPWGFVWSVPEGAPAQVLANPGEAAIAIAGAWPDASHIAAMQLSHDGSRLAALTTIGGQSWVQVAAVRRDGDGVPVSLGEPQRIARAAGQGADIAWTDGTSVAAIFVGEGAPWLVTTPIGGPGARRDAPLGTVSLAGGNTIGGLRLHTSAGVLYMQRASTWQPGAEGVLVLATQQGMR
ncbi:MAG: LpqB family beta-propeller domain-containing protein [Microbacteriaceae bacterium]